MSSHGSFACVLSCMDGRCQQHAFEYAQRLFGAEHIDTVTEPGLDGILAGSSSPVYSKPGAVGAAQEAVMLKAAVSAKGHGATQCLVIGHNECAGNPVSHEQHVADIKKAVAKVKSWGLFKEVHAAVFNPEWQLVEIKA